MNQRHSLAVTAGAATLLAAFPMSTIFLSFSWFFYAAAAIAVVSGSAMLVRALRGPVYAQAIAMLVALLLFATLVFPSGHEWARFIPSGATFLHFNDLLVAAGQQIRDYAPPVPDLEGLLLLTTVGIGLVAMLVDLAAVGLRRPALAGLPMLALYSVPVAVIPDGLSFLPFMFAAAGFIWLLISDSVDRVRRFGRRFTGEGRDVDVWEASPLSSAGRRLGVVGIIVAILIPLAVPGMTSGLLDNFGTGDGPGAGGGGSSRGNTVDLNGFLTGQLTRNQITNMVRVTTNDPAPFYLRIGIADDVTPKGFVSRSPAGNPLSQIPGEYIAPQVNGVTAHPYHADIEVLDLDMNLAPIYEQVIKVTGLGNAWFHEPSSDQVFSRRESVAKRSYGVDFVRVAFTPNALRTAEPIAGNDPVRQLTTVPPIQYVSDLVGQLTNGKSTEYDQVRAIYDYFTGPSSGFTYTLSTVNGNSGSPIVDFLTAKRGFCVQYAAAMAWLVRAAGIPARVAFGFTRGNGLINGGYTLTNLNLHSWTEVYFPGFGWVPFDATPAGSVVGSVQSPWAPDPSQVDPSGSDAPPDVANPSGGPSVSTSAGPGGAVNPGDTGTGAPLINSWWLVGAAGATLIVVLLLVPAMRRRALRRARRSRTGPLIVLGDAPRGDGLRGDAPRRPGQHLLDPAVLDPAAVEGARRDAHAAWAELHDSMIDYWIDVDQAETPRVTAERLNALLAVSAGRAIDVDTQLDMISPDTVSSDTANSDTVDSRAGRLRSGPRHAVPLREQTTLLARAEERARYARTPLHPYGLDAAVVAAREALAGRATRWQRISARLMPRSVLLRWRTAWLSRMARISSRIGRIRDGVATVNPRRLLTRSAR